MSAVLSLQTQVQFKLVRGKLKWSIVHGVRRGCRMLVNPQHRNLTCILYEPASCFIVRLVVIVGPIFSKYISGLLSSLDRLVPYEYLIRVIYARVCVVVPEKIYFYLRGIFYAKHWNITEFVFIPSIKYYVS